MADPIYVQGDGAMPIVKLSRSMSRIVLTDLSLHEARPMVSSFSRDEALRLAAALMQAARDISDVGAFEDRLRGGRR